MKPFETYQHVDGEPMTERDKLEVDSKFWNDGKFENFVLPFLPIKCDEFSFVDMGCNAGIFLKKATDLGFGRVIGVENNTDALIRASKYRSKNNMQYDLLNRSIENCIDDLPAVDYTVLANVHYYFKKDDWKEYIEKLKYKTRYCIIVTAKKKPNEKYAPSHIAGIVHDLDEWEKVSMIELPQTDDPHPRELTAILFKSPYLKRIDVDMLDNGNNQQRGFLKQVDSGLRPLQTDYYRRLYDYRHRNGSNQSMWTESEIKDYIEERFNLYNEIRLKGIKEPITVREKDMRITDGNHRHDIIKHLGGKSILCVVE